MKCIFDLIAAFMPPLLAPLYKFIKLEMLVCYIKGVDGVRRIFVLNVLAIFFALFVVAGFVIIHFALFLLLPWDQTIKAIILLVLGCLYFIIPSILILRICSRRAWLKMSGAEAMHRSISGED